MARRVFYSFLIVSMFSASFATELQAAAAPSEALIERIVKLIGNEDREFRAAGLEQVRNGAKGEAATRAFAAELSKLDPSGQVALLNALADRGDTAARQTVLKLAMDSPNETVRAAALSALGKLGTSSDVPLLVGLLAAKSSAVQAAARRSLVIMPGTAISKQLAAEWKTAPAAVQASLIEILTTRRAVSAVPTFLAAAVNDNAAVRTAAMNALGDLGRPEQLPQMLAGVLKAQAGAERDSAEKNVAEVCERTGNEDARGATLIKALDSVTPAERDQLLSVVGRVGGRKLISFVRDVATGSDPARRKLGIDALSKWPDASTADTLLDIATKTTDPAERKLAFQGYVKIAATRDRRNDKQRLERMQQAMKAAKTPEEQALVINRVRSAYDIGSLRFVLPYVAQPQFAQTACETIVEIAHHREVRDPHKAEFDKALDKVIATSKDPVVVERAQRYKRGETWDRSKKK